MLQPLVAYLFHFQLCSLLQQLVDVRSDLSKLLAADLSDQKLQLQTRRQLNSDSSFEAAAIVNGSLPTINALDADLYDWLNDCVDKDTIQKVCAQVVELIYYGHRFQ